MASFCDRNQRYLFVLVCSVLNCYHALIFFLGVLDVCVHHHALYVCSVLLVLWCVGTCLLSRFSV
jgi:hypothetical protein